jgi:hypothetical protein
VTDETEDVSPAQRWRATAPPFTVFLYDVCPDLRLQSPSGAPTTCSARSGYALPPITGSGRRARFEITRRSVPSFSTSFDALDVDLVEARPLRLPLEGR